MGAWDAGSFQNDTALDWVGTLCESGDSEAVRVALTRAREERIPPQPSLIGRLLLGRRRIEPYLEADVASEALAAAEIVAFWLGHPDSHLPEQLEAWARQHSTSFTPEFVTLARQAVTAIKTKSELKDLWEEGNGIVAPKWHGAIADLERRLQNWEK
jgi:Domain of unknown function (DUF4259)